jgi:hypothetical protein
MCLASLLMTVLDALTPSLRGLIADALDESQEAVVAGARALAGGLVGGLKTLAATASGASKRAPGRARHGCRPAVRRLASAGHRLAQRRRRSRACSGTVLAP